MNSLAIVCVDDQKVVLEGLTEQIKRHLEDSCEIEAAESAEEAMEVIEELKADEIEVAVVISDQIMPGMKGDEFLIQLHKKYPNILKIMLTGQASAQSVGNAVNFASLYRYIAKPWDEIDLMLTVKEALRSYVQNRQLAEQNEALQQLNASLEQKVAERTLELTTANAQLQQEIAERKQAQDALKIEQEKSEQLLLNILPKAIAEQLKQDANSHREVGVAIAQQFEKATILFADIVGFTSLSTRISATELVNLLNDIFSGFDQLAERHGLEKIKTIGDAYMVAGGLPVVRADHAEAIANMALDIQETIQNFQIEKGEAFYRASGTPLSIRMGIHTGPVVAGVIGTRKFIYDLWGDTVNVASRMESQGEPGCIQVTAATYQLLKDKYAFKERGALAVRGKGNMVTYWLIGKKG